MKKTLLSIATDFNGSGGDPTLAMEQIAAAGFTHLHWCHQWHTDHMYTDREIAYIASVMKRTGLKLLDIHGSNGSAGGGLCDWGNPDETYRRNGVELVLNRIRMFAMLHGEGSLMMHIPHVRTDYPKDVRKVILKNIDAMRRSLDELVPICRGLGVPLALENMACDSFEILATLFKEYPADVVGLCYDSGHANIRDANGRREGIEHLEEHLDRLMALHLHDNDGTGDLHMPPFYGDVDWKRIAADIRKSAYKRMFSFEIAFYHVKERNPKITTPEQFLADCYKRCKKAAAL